MEAKLCVALLFLGLFSTALGKGGGKRHHHHSHHDNDDDHEKCPAPYSAASNFPLTCTVEDHCSVIKCSGNIDNQVVILMMKIDKSNNPLIARISLKVPGLEYYWSRDFKDGDQIELAKFPISIDGFKSNFKFKLSLTKESDGSETDIVFELTMSAYEGDMGMEAPILRGKLPLRDDVEKEIHVTPGRCQRFKAWWNRQSHAVRAIIVISAVMVLLLSIGGIVYCCKKRRSSGTNTLKVAPPSYHEATSTETKVPLEPLVNEE